MKYALPILLLCGCTKWGPVKYERGTVEDLVYMPEQNGHQSGTGISSNGDVAFTSGPVHINASYGVVFKCQHGNFAIAGAGDRYHALWKRMSKGEKVTISYRVSEEGDFDFLDATPIVDKESDLNIIPTPPYGGLSTVSKDAIFIWQMSAGSESYCTILQDGGVEGSMPWHCYAFLNNSGECKLTRKDGSECVR